MAAEDVPSVCFLFPRLCALHLHRIFPFSLNAISCTATGIFLHKTAIQRHLCLFGCRVGNGHPLTSSHVPIQTSRTSHVRSSLIFPLFHLSRGPGRCQHFWSLFRSRSFPAWWSIEHHSTVNIECMNFLFTSFIYSFIASFYVLQAPHMESRVWIAFYRQSCRCRLFLHWPWHLRYESDCCCWRPLCLHAALLSGVLPLIIPILFFSPPHLWANEPSPCPASLPPPHLILLSYIEVATLFPHSIFQNCATTIYISRAKALPGTTFLPLVPRFSTRIKLPRRLSRFLWREFPSAMDGRTPCSNLVNMLILSIASEWQAKLNATCFSSILTERSRLSTRVTWRQLSLPGMRWWYAIVLCREKR